MEDVIHLRKSKPVMVAAGIIWALVGVAYLLSGKSGAEAAIHHSLLEFGELFLFLLAAMTYINTMEERGVFDALRAWLVTRGFSLRSIFWVTGLLSFFLSGVADNLTTALLMSTVIMAVGGSNARFVVIGCVNVVVAANAGGAFSPFGDLTTLMVWQKGMVDFTEFFVLFLPSVVNWLIPAVFMGLAVSNERPEALKETVVLKMGAWVVVALFILTIAMAVSAHSLLHLPPVIGMTTGLGLLNLYGYYLAFHDHEEIPNQRASSAGLMHLDNEEEQFEAPRQRFDIYRQVERAEWDTLMFFYGIILCVGGLATLGYLQLGSEWLYGGLGDSTANILLGVISAVVDNVPVMFAVLTMQPEMSHGQWLLITLTAGVGGSLLSVGSAAGVAVMGQARGVYTFFAHLKWTWAIALGYAASIAVHFWLNADKF
ncbi:MAG: sodium:proton antiporter NhaD, partial [Nevskiales bacterium]